MFNEENFKKLVAKNLSFYRKTNNLTQLELAEKGFELDRSIKICFKKVEEKMIESLSDDDVKELKEILGKLRDNLRKEK